MACAGGRVRSLRIYSIRAKSSEPDIPLDGEEEGNDCPVWNSDDTGTPVREVRVLLDREGTIGASKGGRANGEAGAVDARNSSTSMLCDKISPVI